jgi:NADH-quinone oxidoreductase subunit N
MTQDFLMMLPLLVVGAGAIVLMLASVMKKLSPEIASVFSMAVFAAAFSLQLTYSVSAPVSPYPGIFKGMLVVNGFTEVANLILLACGFFTCMTSPSYFQENRFYKTEYFSLIQYAVFGMMLLVMSAELLTLFIALEIMSLSVYVLVGFNRDSVSSTEAVFKYLMLGAFAGGFYAMGMAFVYGSVASTNFVEIGQVIASRGFVGSPLLLGGFFLMALAFLFKVAAFPFHAWCIDVYEGASTPITGFMATAVKTAVFAVFVKLLLIHGEVQGVWINYLFYISIFTMFAGNLIAIGQLRVKRMLAASGIVHSGYLFIAMIAMGSKSPTGSVVLFYLAAYAVATLGIFAVLGYLTGEGEKRKEFSDFRGLAKVRPFSSAAISIFLLSMAGIPPTAGFMGKLYIITDAISAGFVLLAVLGILSSILSLYYYLKLIIAMYFYAPVEDFQIKRSVFAPICALILVISVFAIGFYPVAL